MEKLVKQILTRYQGSKLSWKKDWLLKMISICFAIFLWYFVTGEDRVDMNVQIPVEIVNLPRELVISNQYKNKLNVTVSGPRGMIRKISQQEISRTIDLSNASPGNVVVRNEPESISFPHGIRVLRIQPAQVILLLDRMIQKELPIKYVTSGKLNKDYELTGITLNPNKLTISGPGAIIGKETSITTTPISLNGLTESAIKQVSLDLRPEIANLIGESIITANLEITDKLADHTIWKVPVVINNLAPGLSGSAYPEKIKIKALIPLKLEQGNVPLRDLFRASIDAEALVDGEHEVMLSVSQTAPNIVLQEVVPNTIKLVIKADSVPVTQDKEPPSPVKE